MWTWELGEWTCNINVGDILRYTKSVIQHTIIPKSSEWTWTDRERVETREWTKLEVEFESELRLSWRLLGRNRGELHILECTTWNSHTTESSGYRVQWQEQPPERRAGGREETSRREWGLEKKEGRETEGATTSSLTNSRFYSNIIKNKCSRNSVDWTSRMSV